MRKCLQAAKAVQCSLEYTTLRKVTQATEIYYDPEPMVRLVVKKGKLHFCFTLNCRDTAGKAVVRG
jgi:hypothetical protein